MTNNTRIVLLPVWMQMVHSAMYTDIARHLVKIADLSPRLWIALRTRNAGRCTGVSARAVIGPVRFRSVACRQGTLPGGLEGPLARISASS